MAQIPIPFSSSFRSLTLNVTTGTVPNQVTHTQPITSVFQGNNSVAITDAGILNAFNSQAMGTSFTPSIDAKYGSDGNGNAITTISTPSVASFIPRVISLGNIPSKNTNNAPFSLTSLINTVSAGVLSYSSSVTSVATVNSSGQVTLVGVGTTTITVNQAATANHIAGSASATLSVAEAPLRLLVGAKSLSDSAFMLKATALVEPTYTTNSYTQVGQSLTHASATPGFPSIVKMSADGNKIVVGGIGGNNAGIVRVYGLVNGTWTQTGGDIVGSSGGVYAGVASEQLGFNTISMSADGNLLTIVESGYAYQTGKTHVFKYDASKTTAQTNYALANFGPAKWSKVSTLQMSGTRPGAVLSADGKTMAVTDVTLRMYRSTDGGTTWIQRGTSLIGPINEFYGYFTTSISISADGLSVLAATSTAAGIVNAQFIVYEWDGSAWNPSILREYSHGVSSYTAISADGKVCIVSTSNSAAGTILYRYTKNASNVWTLAAVNSVGYPWVNTLSLPPSFTIGTSADGSLLLLTRQNYNQTTYGDVDVHHWTGTAYTPIIHNRSITDRIGNSNTAFNAMLSSDGTRLVAGGVGKVDVYDLNVSNKITYTSSDSNVVSVYGNIALLNATGTATITATQSDNTAYDTISVS